MEQKVRFEFFKYDNYRKLLMDYVQYRKAQGLPFSFRWFSKEAGFTSPNFLKLVMDGKRDVSGDTIGRIVKVFKWNKTQGEFFYQLVQMNQSKHFLQKQMAADSILKIRGIEPLTALQREKLNYYAKWYHIPIREMVGLQDFDPDPQVIASRMWPAISADEAKKALEVLLHLDLIEEVDGKWRQKDSHLSTGDNFVSIAVVQFHKKMMELASSALDRVLRDEREISSSTVTLSKERAQQLKKLIADFRQNLLKFSEEDPCPEEVYQINFQMFPLTKKKIQKDQKILKTSEGTKDGI